MVGDIVIDLTDDRVPNAIERVCKGLDETLTESEPDVEYDVLPDIDFVNKEDNEMRPLREALDESDGIELNVADRELDPDTHAEVLEDNVRFVVAEPLFVVESQWDAV